MFYHFEMSFPFCKKKKKLRLEASELSDQTVVYDAQAKDFVSTNGAAMSDEILKDVDLQEPNILSTAVVGKIH